MKTLIFALTVILSSLSFAQEKTAFTDIRFDSAPYVKVEVNEILYNLREINGTTREVLMEKCTATYGEACQCMFAEKFTETMAGIGLPVGDSITAVLYDSTTHDMPTLVLDVTADNLEILRYMRDSRKELCY